jgi:hypothetical protein
VVLAQDLARLVFLADSEQVPGRFRLGEKDEYEPGRQPDEPEDAPTVGRREGFRGPTRQHVTAGDVTADEHHLPAAVTRRYGLGQQCVNATGSIPPTPTPMMKHISRFRLKLGMAPQIEVPTKITPASSMAARRRRPAMDERASG